MEDRPNTDFTIDRQPIVVTLILLFLAMGICTVLSFFVTMMLGSIWGIEDAGTAIQSLSENSTPTDRDFVRFSTIANQLLSFLIPALFFTFFFYKNKWASFLRISDFPKLSNLFLGAILMIVALPLVQFTYWINLKIPLPEWAIELEELTASLVENLLRVDQPYELWFNIFVVAVIPAICEEFLFRGVIQNKLYHWVRNPHVAIWIAAFIFSAIHFQFQGFLPRVLLGAVLGYLFYWTGNLWVAVFGHFVNNAFSVVGQYLHQTGQIDIDLDNTDEVSWTATIISLVVVLFLGNLFLKNNLPHRQAGKTNTESDLIA